MRFVLRFAFQHEKCREEGELPLIVLGLFHHERLKRREVVRQFGETLAERAGVFHLRREELHRHRQAGRGEDFFGDAREDILGGVVLPEPLAQNPEEVRLLDAFVAFGEFSRGHSGILPNLCGAVLSVSETSAMIRR